VFVCPPFIVGFVLVGARARVYIAVLVGLRARADRSSRKMERSVGGEQL
jgi:hypothetical protein